MSRTPTMVDSLIMCMLLPARYRSSLLPSALLQEIEHNEAERELDLRVQDDILGEEKDRKAREDRIMNERLQLDASDALIDWEKKVITPCAHVCAHVVCAHVLCEYCVCMYACDR